MAPRGPRGASLAGREQSRSSSTNSRAATRGGIQKRRGGGIARVDSDGDLEMNAAQRRTAVKNMRRDTHATTRTTRSTTTAAAAAALAIGAGAAAGAGRHADLIWLRVRGLKKSKAASNPGGGVRELLAFLERKATGVAGRRAVSIRQHRVVGDSVLIGAKKDDADEILKCNGFGFAGATLEITLESPPAPQNGPRSDEARELLDKLKGILSERYVAENKLLKLDALSQDARIVSLGLMSTPERAAKVFRGFMTVCDDLFKTRKAKQDAIVSITLADNGIDNVNQVEQLAQTFPDLENLDLSRNRLSSLQGLEPWKNRFKLLQTLFLAGNPMSTAPDSYRAQLLEWYPKLLNLDGVIVRTPADIAAAAAANAAKAEAARPNPLPQHGPDFRDSGGVGEAFLLAFFVAYDTDRAALAQTYYDDESTFSLAVDNVSIRDSKLPPPLPWSAYLRLSRNLTKITHANSRMQRLFRGGNVISDLWKTLPRTVHPDIKRDMSKYIMDCHVVPGLVDPTGVNARGVDGMIITVHGEFDELDQSSLIAGKRSFSRSFVLGPGAPGRNSVRVVSDMLCLRTFNPVPNIFQPAHPTQQERLAMIAELSKRTGMTPAYAEACLNEPKVAWNYMEALRVTQQDRLAMITELSKRTGMTQAYSELCLSEPKVSWNYMEALRVFNEMKSTLPPEAFPAPSKGIS